MSEFWPIPILDRVSGSTFGSAEENEEIKRKLLEAWQLKSLN